MKTWFATDAEGRVNSSTTVEDYTDDSFTEVEVDDDFDFNYQGDYKLVDGELVYDGFQTAEENKAQKRIQIEELKKKLTDTDYVITKMTEYNVSGTPMPEDDAARYADIINQRVQWRTEINQLEDEVSADA